MSCSRQASTTSSGSPFFCASVALCSMWVTVCGMKRSLKKSTSVGFGGMGGSGRMSTGAPLGVMPPNSSPTPRRTAALWACFISFSSSASARSSEPTTWVFMASSLWLDLRQLDVALPALRVALQQRLHLRRRPRERIERGIGQEFLRVLGGGDLVEPAGEPVDDRLGRAARDDHAPPGRNIVTTVADLGQRRHRRQRD